MPVYGTEFTLAYVEGKLEEHALLDDAVLNEIRPGERFKIGPFTINPIQVTHSLVDCVALAIHTPIGILIHTGDFKVDPTPTDNRLFDLARLRRVRQGRRAGAVPGFDQRGAQGLHAQRTRGARALPGNLLSRRTPSVHHLLLVVHPSHQADHGAGLRERPQGCAGRALDDGVGRDRAGPRLHRRARRAADSSRADSRLPAGKSLRADQRHPGRAHVGTVARRCRQSQARAHSAGRHRGAVVAHYSREREGDLSRGRPSVPPRRPRHLRRRFVAAGARQRTRQPGRAEAHHQPGKAAILHSRSTANTASSNCTPRWRAPCTARSAR